MTRYFPATSDQVPWTTALLSLLPLFLAGPGRIIVFYESEFGSAREQWYFFPYLVLCCLAAMLSVGLGGLKKFPRWSYPYIFTLAFALTDLYNTATIHYGRYTIGQNSFFLFLALIFLALGGLPSQRSFYQNIRQDWTLLSYSLFGIVLFLLAGVDRDESPLLNLAVLLPSLIALGAALAHMRIRQAPVRILALLAGMFAGLFFWLISIFTGMISIFIGIVMGSLMLLAYGAVLTAILLSPLLVILIRRGLFTN